MNNVLHETTKEMWLESLEHAKDVFSKDENHNKNIFVDEDIVNVVSGFMAAPVSLFEGKAVEACTVFRDSLEDLKAWVNEESKRSKMVIYMTLEENGRYLWRGALVLPQNENN
jgi:hypothetical protein